MAQEESGRGCDVAGRTGQPQQPDGEIAPRCHHVWGRMRADL
jgi:hypothetical protein